MFWSATDDAVVEVADQLHCLANACVAQELAALVVVDQRELWRLDGARSMVSWVEMRQGVSHATAVVKVRVARGLLWCPELAARFEAGHLSWDQLVSCVDLVAFGGLADAEVAKDAVGRTSAELDRLAREARKVSRTESEERNRKRRLRMRWRRDGMLAGSFLLPEDDGKVVETAIRRLAEDQPAEPSSAVTRDFEERQADALVDLASARLAADADPDLATVVVHVDAAAVLEGDDTVEAVASLQLGPLVSRSTAIRLCCDGRIQVVVDDADGASIAVSRTEHAIPRWMRRKVLHRDGGCRWYGCGRTALLHVHHVEWWSRGGLTEDRNLVGLCRFHHRLVHEGGWTIEGDPHHTLTFRGPTGRILRTGPPGLRTDLRRSLWPDWNGNERQPIVAA